MMTPSEPCLFLPEERCSLDLLLELTVAEVGDVVTKGQKGSQCHHFHIHQKV
jgi:hypothetical protein